MRHDPLSGARGSFRLSVFTRSSRATRCRPQWTCGRSGASCTCSSPAASSSRARTSGSEEPLPCRPNVVDSIKHFCVDMLEFPDYVPEVARVRIDDASQLQDLIRQMLNHDPKKRITAQDAIVMRVPLFFLETSVLCRHWLHDALFPDPSFCTPLSATPCNLWRRLGERTERTAREHRWVLSGADEDGAGR